MHRAVCISRERLEVDVRAILETVAMPTGYPEAIDAAIAVYVGQEGRKSRKETLRGLEERQGRLNEIYEPRPHRGRRVPHQVR
jgi:hypothetical protein